MLNRYVIAAAGALTLAAFTAAAQPPPPAVQPAPVQPGYTPGPGVPASATPMAGSKAMLGVKDLMRHVVNPAAESFWQAGGEVDEGDKRNLRTPQDDAKWEKAENDASVLLESGNLLLMQGRARADPQWVRWAQDLSEAGAAGIKAAKARDGEATFTAGSAAYDACFNCHAKYISRGVRETPKPLPDLPEGEKPKSLR